ncbi:MAG: hypothetical protein Q9181_007811 [Wetmoreana brouardii]
MQPFARRSMPAIAYTLEDLASRKLGVLKQLAELSGISTFASRSTEAFKALPKTTDVKVGSRRHALLDTGRRWAYPSAKRVLEGLPPPSPGQRRRIPTMVNANHIPFLRFKKPQSPFLSHMIRKKTDEREKRVDRTQALQKMLILAEDEDQWDQILCENNGVVSDDNGARWASATREAFLDVKSVHAMNTSKRMHGARRMFEIVQEEGRMAEKERLERRNRRHQAYKARRRLREAEKKDGRNLFNDEDTSAPSAAAS